MIAHNFVCDQNHDHNATNQTTNLLLLFFEECATLCYYACNETRMYYLKIYRRYLVETSAADLTYIKKTLNDTNKAGTVPSQ